MTNYADEIVERIRRVVGPGEHPLHRPLLGDPEKDHLNRCIDSTFVSTVGPFVAEFEQKLATFLGVPHVIAVSNGTAALHVALLTAGVKENDEVLVPSLTFVATANAVSYCGAIPHFVDTCTESLGVDPDLTRAWLTKIAQVRDGSCINRQTGRIIRAIVPVHIFGHPCRIIELKQLAEDFYLQVVEDAAESLGSTFSGSHCGTFGSVGVLSFNGNKILTTGGGGAVIVKDSETAQRIRHLTTTAKVPHPWEYEHDQIAFNYRMPNLNAALGCAQFDRLEASIESKRRLASEYADSFRDCSGIQVFQERDGCRSNYWLQTLLLNENYSDCRDEILAKAHSSGLLCRPAWRPLHFLLPYRGSPRSTLSRTENLFQRVINVPSSAGIR